MHRIEVQTAGLTCAWRGIYVYGPDILRPGEQAMLGRIVIDPRDGVRPTLSLSIARPYKSCTGWRCSAGRGFTMPLPYVPWTFVVRGNYSRFRMSLYRCSSMFWHRMDTRYRKPRAAR